MLTPKYVKETIITTLGGSDVAVELTSTDLDVCIKEAVRRYSRMNPLKNREARQVAPAAISAFELKPYCRDVVDVEISNPIQNFEVMSSQEFNLFNSWHLINAGYSTGLSKADEYQLTLIWREMTSKIYSLDPDYYIDEDIQFDETSDDVTATKPRCIHFFNPTGLSFKCSWIEVADRPLEKVTSRDEDWVLDYSLAHAKEILGRKRGKFRTLPVAGQPLELDGIALLEEAKQEKLELNEELRQRFIGVNYPVWG